MELIKNWAATRCTGSLVWQAEMSEPWVVVSLRGLPGGRWRMSARAVDTELDLLLHGGTVSPSELNLVQAQQWAVARIESIVRLMLARRSGAK